MSFHIVADGRERLVCSPEFQDRLKRLRESIRAQYAAELSRAGFLRRLVLRWRLAKRFRKERQKFAPSPYALYGNHVAMNRTGVEQILTLEAATKQRRQREPLQRFGASITIRHAVQRVSAGHFTLGINNYEYSLPASDTSSFKVSFRREFSQANYVKAVVRVVGAKDARARF